VFIRDEETDGEVCTKPHGNLGYMSPVAHHRMDMGHGHAGNGHAAMVTDFRDRFWISMILTVPILALSPLVQDLHARVACL
jgi:P-type Cu2+ transporter